MDIFPTSESLESRAHFTSSALDGPRGNLMLKGMEDHNSIYTQYFSRQRSLLLQRADTR